MNIIFVLRESSACVFPNFCHTLDWDEGRGQAYQSLRARVL